MMMPVAAGDREKAVAGSTHLESPVRPHLGAIIDCFERVLRLDSLAAGDDFFEMGGDSASALELAMELEEATGIGVPMTAAFEAPTPAQMALLIEAYRGRRSGAPVLLKQGTGDGAVFLFPGAGGAAVGLRAFARALATGRAVYGFDAPGLDGKHKPLDRVEDLAAHHLPYVREVQPHGPYCLAGYSVGGLVAYEIARRLRSQGEDVELVGLIDTVIARRHYGWPAILRIWARRARRHLQVARDMRPMRALNYAMTHLRNVVPDILPPKNRWRIHLVSVSDAGAEANRHYVPRRTPGRVALLWSEAAAEHNSLDIVWRTRARHLTVYRLPGDHTSAITTHATEAAAAFSMALSGQVPDLRTGSKK